jgi:hypothetical protein
MASKAYGQFIGKALNKEIDWDSDDIRVMLVSSAYSPNQDTHDYLDDVQGNEVSGSGYTAGGAALTSKTLTYDASTNTITLDAADVTWATSTVTARYAIVYNNTGASAAAKPLIAYVDFVSDQSSTAGNFTVVWDSAGIVRLTTA